VIYCRANVEERKKLHAVLSPILEGTHISLENLDEFIANRFDVVRANRIVRSWCWDLFPTEEEVSIEEFIGYIQFLVL